MNNIKRLLNKSNVPDDGTCTICCSLMFGPKHEPKLFNPCKHLLCTDCDIKVENKCPICRSERKGPSNLHRKLRDEIGRLDAFCKGDGCFVEGKLQELTEHELKCQYCELCCQYCGGYFPKGVGHEMKCWYKCRHCQEKLLFKDSTPDEHEAKCPKFPVCCSSAKFGCRKKLLREELPEHLRTCPFHQIRDFLKIKFLELDNFKLQMLSAQKSEMLIRKQYLETIVKHQKLLAKYQALYKENVKLLQKMKNDATKKENHLLLVKKNRGTEEKYIKLSEQFIRIREQNKKLQERILATDQQVRQEAIKTAMSENRAEEFHRLLEKFHTDATVQYQLQHAELSRKYKSFRAIHQDAIKQHFENMLKKSGELFRSLYGDVWSKDIELANEMTTLKEDDFNFLQQYQKLMANWVTGIGRLFRAFTYKHMGIQEKQLEKLGCFFGLTSISSEKDNVRDDIWEDVDFKNVAPQVLRNYNIKQLEWKIKQLEGLRDGDNPITEEILHNAATEDTLLAVIDSPEISEMDPNNEVKVSPDEEAKTVYEIDPAFKLDMSEFRLYPSPPVANNAVGRGGMDLTELFEEKKEPLALPAQEITLSEHKQEADEKQPINLSPYTQSNNVREPSSEQRAQSNRSNSWVSSETRNRTEQKIKEAGLEPVDVGLGIRPIMLDPVAVARALRKESRSLLGIRN